MMRSWTSTGSLSTMMVTNHSSPCQGAGHAIIAPARPLVPLELAERLLQLRSFVCVHGPASFSC